MAKYNRVPSGQAGTGEAYILPDSKALDALIQNVDYNRKMGLLNVKARNDYQNQTNKDFLDNQMKVKSGILYQDELNKAAQQWTDKGAQYRAQGFNPFNPNPNNPDEVQASSDFLKEKAQIQGMAETRDLYQKNFMDQQNTYEKGGVDEDSWSTLQSFYKNNRLADLYAGGVTPPTLMKAFDMQGFMKDIKAPTIKSNKIADGIETTTVAPNRAAIRMNIEQAVAQNPQAQRDLFKRYSIDPKQAPAGTLIGTVDPMEIDAYMDEYLKTTPEGRDAVIKALPPGTVPSLNSPEYNKIKNSFVDKQLQQESRYERAMQTLAQQKENEVNRQNLTDYNFDLENQQIKREDQGMQRTRFGWEAWDQKNKREDRKFKDAETNKRDEWIQGLQTGSREYVQKLRQVVKPRGGSVAFLPDGKMRVSFQKEYYGKSNKYTRDIDLSNLNDEGYVAINELLNEVASKEIPIETLQSKPAYSGGLVDVGDISVTKPQIKYLRDKFKGNFKDLGDFLINQGGFNSRTEAYKTAAEILDAKGRYHIIQQKKK